MYKECHLKAVQDKCNHFPKIMYNKLPLLHVHSSVPKDRDKFYFKLRQGVQKKVALSVQQMCNRELGIER